MWSLGLRILSLWAAEIWFLVVGGIGFVLGVAEQDTDNSSPATVGRSEVLGYAAWFVRMGNRKLMGDAVSSMFAIISAERMF